MLHKFRSFFLMAIAVGFLAACEDIVDVDTDEGAPQLVVDAFINHLPERQEIKITKSQPYFDNSSPNPVENAEVYLLDKDDNRTDFDFDVESGVYFWEPEHEEDSLVLFGQSYRLRVNADGEEFEASSRVNRIPPIDTIFSSFEEAGLFNDERYIVELTIVDPPGVGDTYWFRVYRNGVRYKEPGDVILAFDAAFDPGQGDGIPIIPPITGSVNIEDYEVGDEITVEVYAITNETYYFLREARTQATNGGIFASPPANVRSNLRNRNPESNEKALGWFSTSSVSRESIVIESAE